MADTTTAPELDFMAMMTAKHVAKVRAMQPQVGYFVNLDSWCGDVWAEIEHCHDDGGVSGGRDNPMIGFYHYRQGQEHKATDLSFFSYVGKVRPYLPADARIVHLKEGLWGGRDATLKAIPKRIQRGPRDYTPTPVVTPKPVKQPRDRYLAPGQITFDLSYTVTVSTNAFEGLRGDTIDALMDRLLDQEWITEVDYHGSVDVKVSDPSELPARLEQLRVLLSKKQRVKRS